MPYLPSCHTLQNQLRVLFDCVIFWVEPFVNKIKSHIKLSPLESRADKVTNASVVKLLFGTLTNTIRIPHIYQATNSRICNASLGWILVDIALTETIYPLRFLSLQTPVLKSKVGKSDKWQGQAPSTSASTSTQVPKHAASLGDHRVIWAAGNLARSWQVP